jgi:diguanylate cyclase (GGDEF)-like protein
MQGVQGSGSESVYRRTSCRTLVVETALVLTHNRALPFPTHVRFRFQHSAGTRAPARYPVGIIMIDLDHFKRFNDAYGHEAGDGLLRLVGNTLQRSIRADDIACRYGGEEFTLILPEASLIDAAQRAESVRESIKALTMEYRRQHLESVTASAGVAIYPDHGPTGNTVLRAADAALYQAKSRGRDRVIVNQGGGAMGDAMPRRSAEAFALLWPLDGRRLLRA